MGDGSRQLDYEAAEVRPSVGRSAVAAIGVSAAFVASSLLVMMPDLHDRSRPVAVWPWIVTGLGTGWMISRVRWRARRGRWQESRLGWLAMALLILGLALGARGLAEKYIVGHRRGLVSYRVMCASNMKQIGSAILLYSNENQGRYPDRLEQLLLTQDIAAEAFVCPLTDDVDARGPTTRAVADALTSGGHLSYAYVGAGLTDHASPDTVVLYEPLANHVGQGMNVLFGDGHVDFMTAVEAREIVDRVAAGERPVIWKGPGFRPTTGLATN